MISSERTNFSQRVCNQATAEATERVRLVLSADVENGGPKTALRCV
jgi:hypothetical protein